MKLKGKIQRILPIQQGTSKAGIEWLEANRDKITDKKIFGGTE